MSFKECQIALDTKLNLLPGSVPIAWENTAYKPVLNQPWIRPTNLPLLSSLLDLQTDQQNPGIYRVDVFYPLGKGHKALMDKLDAIYNHFKMEQLLIVNSTWVYIREMSLIPRQSEESWIVGSINIGYVNYENAVGTFTPPSSMGWIVAKNNLTMSFDNRYIANNDDARVIFTIPDTFAQGSYFRIAGYGAAGWRLQCPAGVKIIEGDQETTLGGYLESTNARDCVELVCVVADQVFQVLSSQGNITIV